MKQLSNVIMIGLLMVLAAACSEGSLPDYNYNGAQDTVITLSTPSVSAKAYPGYNIVSWQPVPGNNGYQVYRYEDGNLTDKVIEKKDFGTMTYYEDTDVQNGVTYKYEVMALGMIGGRSIETFDSSVGSASCVGIVPPLETSALNLAAYEGGYTEGKEKEIAEGSAEEKWLLNDETIETYIENGVTINDLGRFAVKFPAKAYLEYSAVATKGKEYDVTKLFNDKDDCTVDIIDTVVNNSYLYLHNIKDNGKGITASGDYTIYIKVSAKNVAFINYDIVKAGTISVPELVTKDAPKFISIAYTDENKDTVKITMEKLGLDNSHFVKPECYKVYKTEANKKNYTLVSGTVVENDEGTAYILEDECGGAEMTTKYYYILVVSEGKKYCKSFDMKEFQHTAP